MNSHSEGTFQDVRCPFDPQRGDAMTTAATPEKCENPNCRFCFNDTCMIVESYFTLQKIQAKLDKLA